MALGTVLPLWPALLFTYIEPIALLLGWKDSFENPSNFVTRQLPTAPLSPVPDAALVLAYTLGNIFLLLAGLAIVCTVITREGGVARCYLVVVGLADVGHIYASYRILGTEAFLNFGNYNDMMWGNIGFSAFLHVNRFFTIIGLFGRLGPKA